MQSIVSTIPLPRIGAAWLQAPGERSSTFLQAFSQVSLVIQSILRERISATHFSDPLSYDDLKSAYPMLVYQASRPFRGKVRSELTYDVLNTKTLATLFRTVKPNLIELLDQTEMRLKAAGRDELARKYASRYINEIIQSVQRLNKSRKCLFLLIRGESVLVNAVVDLGGLGELSPREQARRIAAFEKKWSFQLRRLNPGADFSWLADPLLNGATDALQRFLDAPTPSSETAALDLDGLIR